MPERSSNGACGLTAPFVRVRSLRVHFAANLAWGMPRPFRRKGWGIDEAGAQLRPGQDSRAVSLSYPSLRAGRSTAEEGRARATAASRRAKIVAVDDVSFDIARGHTLGLVGESGCGKTTLGRAILRLVPVAAGEVSIGGVDILALQGRALRRFRRRMQMVFQDASGSLNPRMTVGGIVGDPVVAHALAGGTALMDRVAELLAWVGLDPAHVHRYPHELSGGQRQRVGIARAMALDPEFVVCDEPVSALDVPAQGEILNLLGELKERLGLSYLFITHSLAVAERFSDEVAVMYLGKIVETGLAADVFAHARHPYTLALRAAVPAPDPTRRGELVALGGEVPSPLNPPAGCAFHPRCRFASERCREEIPALKPGEGRSADHLVACHRADETLSYADLPGASGS